MERLGSGTCLKPAPLAPTYLVRVKNARAPTPLGGVCVQNEMKFVSIASAMAETSLNLHPTKREIAGPFSIRRYCAHPAPVRTIMFLDDELIGDAAIAAARARTIDGTLQAIELFVECGGFDALRLISPTLWLDTKLGGHLAVAIERRSDACVAVAVGEKEADVAFSQSRSMFEQVDALAKTLASSVGSRVRCFAGERDDHTLVITSQMDRMVVALGAVK